MPAMVRTRSSSTVPPNAAQVSKRESASRREPSAKTASKEAAGSLRSIFSSPDTQSNRCAMASRPMRKKSKRWQRDKMVAGTLWISVVAKIKITWEGGSSSIFSKALNACIDNMCTSSMMYTLYRQRPGRYMVSLRNSRTSSTPLLEAASISTTSSRPPLSMPRQHGQVLQGPSSCKFSQLTALANTLAQLVFPVPRVPVNK